MVQTLFVYYKLPHTEHALWRARVLNFVASVQNEMPQLEITLMQRPQISPEGLETWMEIYRSEEGLDEATLSQIAALAEQHPWPSKRASEVFVELKS